MWLVLCQDQDVDAGWLTDGLRARTDRRVELVTAGALVHDCRWEHRVGTTDTSSRLVVGDGRTVDSTDLGGVVNRLCWLGAEGFGGASDRDAEYAGGELYSLGLSWLESLGPRVLNRPAGSGLAGTWRTEGRWRSLARSVGLPIVAHDRDATVPADPEPVDASDGTAVPGPDGTAVPGPDDDCVVLVVNGRVLHDGGTRSPAVTSPLSSGLADLQRASGLDVIEVHLAVGDGIAVRSVSYLPGLRRFGDAALDAVHDALIRRSDDR